MRFLFAITWLLSWPVNASEWIEDTLTLGTEPRIQIYGTHDIDAIRPVLEAFVAARSIGLDYVSVSSKDLDQHVVQPRLSPVDVVFSSAVDLQMKAVNDGLAYSFETSEDLQWRGSLFQISLEPIVSLYNTELLPWAAQVNDRADLARRLRERTLAMPQGAVVYDPNLSGLGYLLATQDSEQSDSFWPLIEAISESGISQLCCSSDMLHKVQTGQAALAYNLLESYALERVSFDPSVEILRFGDYQLVVPRTAWVPKWSTRAQDAFEFIQFVRTEGQIALPERNRLKQLSTPQLAPLKPIRLSPALILYLDSYKHRRFMRRWNAATRPID